MNLRAYIVMVEQLPDGQHVTSHELPAQYLRGLSVDQRREFLDRQCRAALTIHNDSPRRGHEAGAHLAPCTQGYDVIHGDELREKILAATGSVKMANALCPPPIP